MKTCTKCGETKPLEMFSRNKTAHDGYQTFCKACMKALTTAWQAANKEKTRETRARCMAKNGHKYAERQRESRAANREHIRARERERRAADPEHRRAQERSRYANSPDKYRAAKREWAAKNPDKVETSSRRTKLQQMTELRPAYVAVVLGISVKDLTPELLALKREQLEIRRLAREAKQQLKELQDETGTNSD